MLSDNQEAPFSSYLCQRKKRKSNKVKKTQLTPEDHQFLKQVEELAKQQIANNHVEVKALAADLCMSLTAFRRRFSALADETPQAYLFRIRMDRARRMLDRHPEKTITDVAMSLGFDDKSNFTRAFKKAFNITPSEYKNKQR